MQFFHTKICRDSCRNSHDSLDIAVDPAVRDAMQDRPDRPLQHRIKSGIHSCRARLLEILGELDGRRGGHVGVDARITGMAGGQPSLNPLFIPVRLRKTDCSERSRPSYTDRETF